MIVKSSRTFVSPSFEAHSISSRHGVAQVAVRCLETAVHGARHNVDINLEGIQDPQFRADTVARASKEADTATTNRDRVLDILEKRK